MSSILYGRLVTLEANHTRFSLPPITYIGELHAIHGPLHVLLPSAFLFEELTPLQLAMRHRSS